MKLILSVKAVCDIGCKKSNNEDMILIQNDIFRDGKKQAAFEITERIVIALADGVGGLENGEIASENALISLRDIVSKLPDDLSSDELREVFFAYTSETHSSMLQNMGTTLAGLFFYNGKLFRYHVGDSRIYRMRRGELTRLTVDHSLRESGGMINAPSNIITNSLGGGLSAFIEFAEIDPPYFSGDIYLLSSDGMHDLVPQKEISSLLNRPNAAEKLTLLAKKYGGNDNISVITINIWDF